MKLYNVTIEAVENGVRKQFIETVIYDLDPASRYSCVPESERERDGVSQLLAKNPKLRNVRAISSISP